ncbi:pilus assembly protein TadG-related protein [Methylobacillus arboreus]|uniref:TadG family pilus assembly protein n=1 Tax=Methylobacillus arboreus TaxID=755170 RepID=UPI001E489B4C|nr:TadG family pilus assembly protein [Methylobacillus arboreus]MCB5189662.1 pilus assembly protein TadG-related protein [Methylobacillus arboreus]
MHTATKKHQQGAIGLFGVLTLMMAVLFVAVVVDSGRLWMIKRQLQNVADMAAIAAGGQAGGCMQGNNTNMQQLVMAAAQNAAVANGYQGNLASAPNIVQLGSYSTSDGVRNFIANNERRAVRVLATQEVPSSLFAGGIFNQRVLLRAEAVAATRNPYAVFRVGSTALAINTAESELLNSLLGRMLQTNVALNVLSYRGLANTNITLLDLLRAGQANGLTVGSVSELLNAPLGLNNFMQLLNVAVTQNGSNVQLLEGVDRGVVENALTKLLGAANSTEIKLGNILQVSNPDSNAVAAAGVNLLSLIQTAALVANGNNFINLPLGVSLLGLANINTQIRVIEPPKLVMGPPAVSGGVACTIARTAQVRVETNVYPSAVLSVLASVDLKLSLEVAQGRAELMDIRTRTGQTDVVIDAYPGLINLRLTKTGDLSKPAEIKALAGVISTNVGLLNNPGQSSPANSSITFNVNHPVAGNVPKSANSYAGTKSLADYTKQSQLVIENVCLVGICLDFIVGPIINTVITPVINGLVVPLLTMVTANVLDPLLKLLGINVAGMTVILDDVNSGSSQALIR